MAGKLPDDAHKWSMQRRWIVMPAGALQDKKSSLAILFALGLNLRLSQVMRPSRQPALFWKTWLFIPTKYWELPERILREKPWRKTRLTYPQSSHRDSSNSSTLIISIVTSLSGSLSKPFLTIPTSLRRSFGAWEAVRKGPILYWLILWFIAESGKLKKK